MRVVATSEGTDASAPIRFVLCDPVDFTSLSLDLSSLGRAAEHAAAQQLGDAGDEHVFVAPERLVALAGEHAQADGWRESFDRMIRFARSNGWSDDSGRVRMHIVR